MSRLPQQLGLICASLLPLIFALSPLSAAEVQQHGLVFEKWIRNTFFNSYAPDSYTQKWDIPAAVNRDHGGLPVNPKATKYGTAVDMGDALRQFDIDEPFILVIGYWRQEGAEKRFVNIVAPVVTPAAQKELWGPVTRADLERLNALIKDRALDYREVRRSAQAMKNAPPFNQAIYTLNPKIDSRGQRRLQCSLGFDQVFKYLAPGADPAAQKTPALWGVPFTTLIHSPPRTLRSGEKQPAPAVR